MNQIKIDVTESEADERLDSFLNDYAEDISRSYIQRLIKEGNVTVNLIAVIKPSYKVHDGDQIVFSVPESVEPDIEPEDLPLDIIYEDEDLLLVNKPKGMVVHPAAGHYSGTLVNAVMFHCRGNLSGINGVLRPGIVHRIDKDTSGSLLVCKNDFAHRDIAEQLKNHSIKRIYHAIVYGSLTQTDGMIQAPIGRDPRDRLKMAVIPGGKPAVTHYHVIEELKGFTYVSCQLETGRTHQIRVHMSSIGHPVLGDPLYSAGHKCNVRCEGQTLHAKTIGFIHPRTREYMEFDTELPEYFKHFLDIFRE